MFVHLGLDDTDSRLGECTTYLATRVVAELLTQGAEFADYPNLVRLNPNIPWKTKGNAAVCLRFRVQKHFAAFEVAKKVVYEYASDGAHPGVALYEGERVPWDLKDLYFDALMGVIGRRRVLEVVERHRLLVEGGMGVIGAVASIGADLTGDHTYELLAYRRSEKWGSPRRVNYESVLKMNEATKPYTFNNVDVEKRRILISPRGPDPVLVGIRGEDPEVLFEALKLIELEEPVDRYMFFRSNQGTGVHLSNKIRIASLKPYSSVRVCGSVAGKPWVEQGGHVFFKIQDDSGVCLCAVYEPAGGLRKVALQLAQGDVVEVGGGVRKPTSKHPSALNVEQIRVISLTDVFERKSPLCDSCGHRLTSAGRMKGYKCRRCGFKDLLGEKDVIQQSRLIKTGFYLPPLRAQRHLTKPSTRIGLEKESYSGGLCSNWFSSSGMLERPIRT